jgi:two-component system response regulator RegA
MAASDPARPTLLLVDDDRVFSAVLAKALDRRGYIVEKATDVAEAEALVSQCTPDYAIVDLRIGAESGLNVIRTLAARSPRTRAVVLTGYGSIVTAVEAIKLGAVHYLTKPVEVEEILSALQAEAPVPGINLPTRPLSARRAEWEHIQRVLSSHDGNISAAARALGMHRRTLQRKLRKRPTRT